MKRIALTTLAILLGMGSFTIGNSPVNAAPPGPPPDIQVVLSLDKSTYYPGDPIMVSVALVNSGADEIIKKEWSNMEFWLLLQFFDDKENIITSDKLRESSTFPPPSRVFPDGSGMLVQGTLVEILNDEWNVGFGPFDAYTYYPLENRSGHFRVKAVVPAISFLIYEQTNLGVKYAPRYPTDTVKWNGSLESEFASFTLIGDADGDGYYYPVAHGMHPEIDCDDHDASVNPGMIEQPGNGKDDDCNPETSDVVIVGTITVKFDLHTVGMGNYPGSTKEPCVGAQVAVFDKFSDCVSGLGFSWHHYQDIWAQCEKVGFSEIDDSGKCNLKVQPGHYYIIGLYDPNGSAYDEHGLHDGDEVYCGVSAGGVESEQTVQKYLQVIVKHGGKKVPGKSKKEKGSELLIIEPEYVEWDGTQEYYPFIFESIGDWSVTTSISPPEGFVADNNNLSEDVNTELKAVQFTITDVGSKWKPTGVTYNLKHKGTKKKIKSNIGVKLSKKLAKKKGLDIFGRKAKKPKKGK